MGWYPLHSLVVGEHTIVNLVKADSYISSKEDGETRLKHLISTFREQNNLPELTEDGGDYADGIKRSEPVSRHSTLAKAIIKKRHHHQEGTAQLCIVQERP